MTELTVSNMMLPVYTGMYSAEWLRAFSVTWTGRRSESTNVLTHAVPWRSAWSGTPPFHMLKPNLPTSGYEGGNIACHH